MAYLAVFHTLRQQVGWLNLYRRVAGETSAWGRLLDHTVVHLAVLYPVVWWHCHAPLKFVWFREGDFVALPPWVESQILGAFALTLVLYALVAIGRYAHGRGTPGKDLLVATTVLTWLVAIVWAHGDYMFTAMSIVPHSVPYIALNLGYLRHRRRSVRQPSVLSWLARHPYVAVGTLWLLAGTEELFWDKAVFHNRADVFGWIGALPIVPEAVATALLSVPQVVHYVLDAFIWRGKTNPTLKNIFRADIFS
jgi:hypothetical protein